MRTPGEGSLYKTIKNGKVYWVAQVVVGTYPNGNPKYARRWRTKRGDASTQLKELLKLKAEGVVPDKSLTTGAFLVDWLDNRMPIHFKREKNRKATRSKIERLVIPVVGAIPLAELSIRNIEDLLSSLIAKGYAPKSVNDLRSLLVTILEYALKHEKVTKNVAKLASTYKVPRPKNEGLTPKQVQAVLKVIKGHPYEAMWLMALTISPRKSELLRLNWSDVDFEHNTITFADTKTPAGDRTIPLVGKLLAALQELEPTEGPVFVSLHTGKRLADPKVNAMWNDILTAADIPHATFHGSTRDTVSNLMHEAGIDKQTRDYIIGHGVKGIDKHYLKPTQKALRDALLKYEDHITP